MCHPSIFASRYGGKLSADGVQALLNKYVAKAREHCVPLRSKRVSPRVLRHSAAMELLQAGVDCSVIALWLGHETMETTLTYLHAHLELKESALAKLKPYERTAAIPVDQLQTVCLARPEDEDRSGERVLAQLVLHERRQPVMAFTIMRSPA
ncbi:rcorf1 [Mesorhizobium alhagi CCNWXJ12-2]|uniref:Rcorf1 n=1 Tax=Mesorhizobium alhagi CCNWXJ12-2 TaxID=1107882 RepID=H0I3Y8_9HYPH|nr:rcorf1 [Mesorhizobium alhagi CCNWXJ12-2]